MLTSGPAKKVAIYVAEDQQYHGNASYAAILEFLFFRAVSGATVTRGIAGFGADHHMHTTRLVDLATRLPIKVEFVETAQKIDELMPKLQAMVGTGLIEMHDTTIVKPAETKKQQLAVPGKPALKSESRAKLMRIYIGENDKCVDTEEKLKAFMPVLDEMVQQGLVVLSDVDVIKYAHDYGKSERRQETRV